MKFIQKVIIGSLILGSSTVMASEVHAYYCNPNQIYTHYQDVYCSIKWDGNDSADEEVIEVVADQFNYDEEIIEAILDGELCRRITEIDQDDLPKDVVRACIEAPKKSSDEVLASWSYLTRIKNTYNKEKALYHNKKNLEFSFEVSELYWDGTLADSMPFDLIVDLNLIEQMLFGSQAQWMNDVFRFPSDEDEDGGGPQQMLPIDQLLGEEGEGEDEGGEEEEGVSVEEEGVAIETGCVPGDHPEADHSAQDLADLIEESGLSESDLMCRDPEAVIFRSPSDDGTGQGQTGTGDEDGTGGCPPGTFPRIPTITAEAPISELVDQLPGYPGPNIGGVLKQFPEGARPICGPGESQLIIESAVFSDFPEISGRSDNITCPSEDLCMTCIPTEWCTDFDDARDFLFGAQWQEDPDIAEIAYAIEAMVCVNITTHMRPESPYAVIEGCVDCHIRAIVDALDEALETNVSPLENTMTAFGISSRWGPKFSFNLNATTKAKFKTVVSDTISKAIEKANQAIEESNRKREVYTPTITPPLPSNDALKKKIAQFQERMAEVLEDTRIYKLSNKVASDQEANLRVVPLIIQFRDSFQRIQDKYVALLGVLELDETPQCTF